MDTKDEFREEIELATKRREAELVTMMQASLKKKLEGYYTTVERDVYVPDEYTGEVVFKKKTITKKECPPDLRTIKMLLEREDKRKEKETERKLKKEEKASDIAVTENEILPKPIDETLESLSQELSEYPPKNECVKREMQVLTCERTRKEERNRRRNMTNEKIKKSVRFVRF